MKTSEAHILRASVPSEFARFEIELTHEPQLAHYIDPATGAEKPTKSHPLQSLCVAGRVHVHLKKQVKAQALGIRFFGIEEDEAHFNDETYMGGYNTNRSALPDESKTFWEGKVLDPGEYVYDFEFAFKPQAPATFRASYCRLLYKLHAVVTPGKNWMGIRPPNIVCEKIVWLKKLMIAPPPAAFPKVFPDEPHNVETLPGLTNEQTTVADIGAAHLTLTTAKRIIFDKEGDTKPGHLELQLNVVPKPGIATPPTVAMQSVEFGFREFLASNYTMTKTEAMVSFALSLGLPGPGSTISSTAGVGAGLGGDAGGDLRYISGPQKYQLGTQARVTEPSVFLLQFVKPQQWHDDVLGRRTSCMHYVEGKVSLTIDGKKEKVKFRMPISVHGSPSVWQDFGADFTGLALDEGAPSPKSSRTDAPAYSP
ncbi:uncharacterized protein EV422DRAFT_566274 [Fimicolochytrium jonesii]|uniref:uncharacterized protein n=1 Tax=Fimicolochytrium jonesii TaxID=1396493 RepID=UPI0022FE632C|nr:uncharacterized protein EV422DRAFT_566274 [Fimicolochytrium jonesii]KAI8822598.1 hypothetical protein EV422DRAFT_566274 [Fimicolochytrium jonesii]